MRLESELSPWVGVLSCSLLELYTYCTRLVEPVGHIGRVRICTAGVWKYRLSKSDLVSQLRYLASFQNRTPTVRGTTGSSNLRTKAVWAPIRQCRWVSCTDPTAVVPKCRLHQSTPLGVCTTMRILELYTYCTRCYSTAQFVHMGCGTHMTYIRKMYGSLRKHSFHHSDLVSEVNCNTHFRNPTLTVRGSLA